LNPLSRNAVMLKELANALALSTSSRSLSLLNFFSTPRLMKRCADEQRISVEPLSCLPS